ncbi:uncharacterized protein LOC125551684 isoform X1 [Triticum urartu]|uniref:uncharacterized protein LOC125551684 isoform X1 n=1 Tax=Triticum urartu TaxID=4572 RepID=UPI0020447664|nr:uncharacterized protein LOC125551684 isoform X1 [Triticum urartu]XP_048570924.1 uncharacterized protein LOC125551684 isoform X1 [Triticum urartu]XP_048570925.1 uncharacterized protein LOC125551684 isoform X1 [Triticum urartu]
MVRSLLGLGFLIGITAVVLDFGLNGDRLKNIVVHKVIGSPSCPWHASRMACAVWEHKPGKLLSRCGAVHGAVTVVLTPWPLPLPSEKKSLACGGGGYYWSGGTFCFPFSSFLERHNMYEEEAMRTTRVEMGMGGELWDDLALVDCLDHAVPPTRHAAGRMVWN